MRLTTLCNTMAIDRRQLLQVGTAKAKTPALGLIWLVATFSFAGCVPPECLDCAPQPCGLTSYVPLEFISAADLLPFAEVLAECESTVEGFREEIRCEGKPPLAITRDEDGEIVLFEEGEPPTRIISYQASATGEYTVEEYLDDPDFERKRYMQFDSFSREIIRRERRQIDRRVTNRSIRFQYSFQSTSKQLDLIEVTVDNGDNVESSRRLIREVDGLNVELVDFGPDGEIDEVKRLEPCCAETC